MARLQSGILGKTTNKVGGVVGSNWKGINTIREYVPPKDAKTELQLENRRIYQQNGRLIRLMLTPFMRKILKQFFAHKNIKLTPQMFFVKHHSVSGDPNGQAYVNISYPKYDPSAWIPRPSINDFSSRWIAYQSAPEYYGKNNFNATAIEARTIGNEFLYLHAESTESEPEASVQLYPQDKAQTMLLATGYLLKYDDPINKKGLRDVMINNSMSLSGNSWTIWNDFINGRIQAV